MQSTIFLNTAEINEAVFRDRAHIFTCRFIRDIHT